MWKNMLDSWNNFWKQDADKWFSDHKGISITIMCFCILILWAGHQSSSSSSSLSKNQSEWESHEKNRIKQETAENNRIQKQNNRKRLKRIKTLCNRASIFLSENEKTFISGQCEDDNLSFIDSVLKQN